MSPAVALSSLTPAQRSLILALLEAERAAATHKVGAVDAPAGHESSDGGRASGTTAVPAPRRPGPDAA